MPTNIKERINISIVDSNTISLLYTLRDELEDDLPKGTRLSLADIIGALVKNSKGHSNTDLLTYFF